VAGSTVGPIGDDAALGMSSIGQKDVAVTPLQNAMVAATVANGGVTMQPYLVENLKGPDLANISSTSPKELRRAVSPQVATTLTDLMIDAEQATQQTGSIAGVQIASKTGTAEHGSDPRNTPPHAWYIAFANYTHDKYFRAGQTIVVVPKLKGHEHNGTHVRTLSSTKAAQNRATERS
jgi:peptidoglycan glycosyltransferase